jgi:serine/threonine protein kinase
VAQLQHPNIVQVFELGEHEGHPFIVLEYVGGGNLAQKLNDTGLSPREAAQLLETLARAIHSAHQQGIIHRDLKPANILITEQGMPKIMDFGLAKFRGLDRPASETEEGVILGTPHYMAPEQAGGASKDVGPAADVYSLGTMFYEMLTGQPPFKAETLLDTLMKARSEEPVPPSRFQPNLPRDLESICLKCLAKEPSRRYASAETLADDLRRFLAGEPVHARPISFWTRLLRLFRFSRRAQRNPRRFHIQIDHDDSVVSPISCRGHVLTFSPPKKFLPFPVRFHRGSAFLLVSGTFLYAGKKGQACPRPMILSL